ncbi:hypothetical protein [Pseudomonas helleri]|uniref:Uncharacterized protein n=1 Tax=Pseudomonas helleri TaxID=1608996 RepID=A0A7X2C6G7_9PSED|nr:hypothetical protein [Pseudomonas helleri]MQT92734.1 hypothetical protein [Pseudomonas helleri]
MSKAKVVLPKSSINGTQKVAGDLEQFSGGQQTYLAPLPLPTAAEPYCPYIGDYNDIYLDFGGGEPNVYSYQIWLGGPFSSSCLMGSSHLRV